MIRTAMVALALASPAAASTLDYPTPVAVPDGLILTLNERGHPSFNPADGVHLFLGGKTAPERLHESLSWDAPPKAPRGLQAHHSRPDFPLPGIPGNSPACDRADNRPAFCDQPAPVPPSVPLPAGLFLLLTGLGALAWVRRG